MMEEQILSKEEKPFLRIKASYSCKDEKENQISPGLIYLEPEHILVGNIENVNITTTQANFMTIFDIVILDKNLINIMLDTKHKDCIVFNLSDRTIKIEK